MLCLDGGSSSLKYAAYRATGDEPRRVVSGTEVASGNADADLDRVLAQTSAHHAGAIDIVGHRIVFGGRRYAAPVVAGDEPLRYLETLVPIEPLHLRSELDLIYAAMRRFPKVPQVLCFDTAFHRQSPDVARRLPLPAEIDPLLERYGFHGLSYEYVAGELGPAAGATVIAHLGSGASLCALRDGKPLDTTMGFSALGGLMMGTRPGDLDPGVVLQLLQCDGYDSSRLTELLYRRSGLFGVSGTSSDMRMLLGAAESDSAAANAVELFVYQLTKHLGAMIAVLGGLQTLVFTAGIGENAAPIRAAACKPFHYLGLRLDPDANTRNARVISAAGSTVEVLVIATDENLMIARHALRLLSQASVKA